MVAVAAAALYLRRVSQRTQSYVVLFVLPILGAAGKMRFDLQPPSFRTSCRSHNSTRRKVTIQVRKENKSQQNNRTGKTVLLQVNIKLSLSLRIFDKNPTNFELKAEISLNEMIKVQMLEKMQQKSCHANLDLCPVHTACLCVLPEAGNGRNFSLERTKDIVYIDL